MVDGDENASQNARFLHAVGSMSMLHGHCPNIIEAP